MRSLLRQRLTYANVMSSLAVFLVLGGATAFAASKIGSSDLKAGAVKTNKIAKEAVTTAKVRNNAINGAKVRDGSLTGADVNAATLGTVPKATEATSAQSAAKATSAQNANTVNRQAVVSFFKEVAAGEGSVTALEFGGLRITVSCEAGKPTLEASRVWSQAATTRVGTIEEAEEAHGNGQASFSTLNLTNGKLLGNGQLEVAFVSGVVTSVDFAWRNDGFNADSCRFFGHATSG
ncbi:MAG TPA: hypothetical protein VGI73_12085 [Solirubrobacterales bacterium]